MTECINPRIALLSLHIGKGIISKGGNKEEKNEDQGKD
jgi:hypothetical protein